MKFKKLLSSMTLASILSIAGGLTTTSIYAAEYKDPEPLPEGTTIEDTFFDQVDDDRVLPTVGTGDYLLWQSQVDGGRVGSFSEAYDTLHGNLSGMELPANTYKYYKNINGQQYFTYNPLEGTRYLVANK